MAIEPTLPSVPAAEYLSADYEPECEYLDGVLAPKPPLTTFIASSRRSYWC